MALTLTLDHNRHRIIEPGYRAHVSAGEALVSSEPAAGTQAANIAADPITGTLFLRPLNLQEHWLNSVDQIDSIIRISDMVVAAGDLSARTVFEEYSFGNTNNFYIYHAPVTFANPPAFGPPGAPPNLVGAPAGDAIQDGLTSIGDETEVPAVNYTAPDTTAGTINSGRVIAYTQETQPANSAFYLRWFHPHPATLDPAGRYTQTRYIFFIGQLAVEVLGSRVILWEDTSSAGDRSSFRRIWAGILFAANAFSEFGRGSHSFFSTFTSNEGNPGDRSLLFIPYFRNRVLLLASYGSNTQAASVPIRSLPKPAPATNQAASGAEHYNWEVTRSDTLAVWALSPSPGRFQVQKVRYADGPVTVYLPRVVLPFTPATAPTVTLFGDEERGTDLTGTVISPAVYNRRFTGYNECPPPETGTGDQSRTYDVTIEFEGESTHRWTPFFYGLDFNSPPVSAVSAATPVSVLDTGVNTSNILSAFVSWGEKPGDGRCEIDLLDEDPYALTPFYYRSSVPLRLVSDGTPIFTGFSDTHQVEPLFPGVRPVRLFMPGTDLWRQLGDTILRDQVSFFGQGHISAVLHLAKQAGIDTTTAETPPLTNAYNTPIGGLETTARTEEEAKLIRDYWRPKNLDTAGSMIQRIAAEYSGWDVGFRTDGTFYYLPKNYQTGVSLRFFHSDAERIAAGLPTNPLVRNPVLVEPRDIDANAVIVYGAENKGGQRLSSQPFIDFASWLNPAAANYIGHLKWIALEIGDTLSCNELNRVARVIWEAARKRKRQIVWESDYVASLKLGQIVEVGTYGEARLKKCKAEFVKNVWSPATYTAEYD